MATPFERVKAAWDSSDRSGELNRLVETMAAEGTTLNALDHALGRLLDEVRAAGVDDDTEEIINSVGDRLHGWCHESYHIKTQPAKLPTSEEIARLPQWAQVAFAARCARRVLPLFFVKWPDAPENYGAKLTWAVEVGERSAARAGAGEDWAPPAGALTCAVYVCDAVINADRDHSRAVEVIKATSDAVAKFKDKSASLFDPHIGTVFHLITNNASAAIANRIATSQATFDAALNVAHSAIRRDFDTILSSAEEQRWTDDTCVPPSVFGPLWPDGRPANWPHEPQFEGELIRLPSVTVRSISELLVRP